MELRDEMCAPTENQEQQTLNPSAPAEETNVEAQASEVINAQVEETESPAQETDAVDAVFQMEDDGEDAPTDFTVPNTKAEIVDALVALLNLPIDKVRDQLTALKTAFYTKRKEEIEAERQKFIEDGNDPNSFEPKEDTDELRVKDILGELKEKRAEYNALIDAVRQNNLAVKKKIIDEINAIASDADGVNRHYQRVQQLQQEFKNIGEVPPEHVTGLWKTYQVAVEYYYDMLKMNKELRDYDFKKNLELKQALCEEAEALGSKEGIVEAFKTLQQLHDKWRQIGPVAKDIREEIWTRFKEASAVVNRRYQTFFEERKEKEQSNETAKIALCEKAEAVVAQGATSFVTWDEATKAIIALQEEWKKLGFASRKVNAQLFARFRKSCDEFFAAKAEYYKSVKDNMSSNLEKKIALCEKAEALKDSTDWRKTTEAFVELQKEWKKIGAVAKKHSDEVWKRFIAACDYFFEQKSQQTVNTRQAEHANLKAKKAVIAGIKELLDAEQPEDAPSKVRELMKQWQEIGHVPFKEKDKVYADYKKVLDEAFDKFDIKETRANLANFENSINQFSGSNQVYRERERLVRSYEAKRQELKTAENNFCFFNAVSKSGNSLIKEAERRINRIKDDIALLEQKIKMIDSKLDSQE
ncbi:MAG: DUF349 domain-containing protein [Muribaculaceae bacterium]|nr:DUF349 domain-containing protein [Muribaculaceae bacterium]